MTEVNKKISSIVVVWGDDVTTEYNDIANVAIEPRVGDGLLQIEDSKGNIDTLNLSFVQSYKIFSEVVH